MQNNLFDFKDLTSEEVNTTMQALAQMPYSLVAQLIPKLHAQINGQIANAKNQ